MNPQQVTFDLGKLVLAGVLGFILAISGNFIFYYTINRDRRIRLLDREGKRHKFWKDFFETQSVLPESVRYTNRDMDAAASKCREELSRSYEEVMDHSARADVYSRAAGMLVVLFFLALIILPGGGYFLFDLLSIGTRMPPDVPPGFRFITDLSATASLWWFFYSVLYRPTRDAAKRKALDRQRQGKPPIKTLHEILDELRALGGSLK